jgi:hypothetical protein
MRMTHKFSFRCHADMSTKGLGLTSVRGRVRVRVMLGLRFYIQQCWSFHWL